MNESTLCRLTGCEAPSLAHLVLSAAVVLFAMFASVVSSLG
ncbi:hypothetical protein [Saccharothrix xinjiangensis]|uniref:Uncharacterized protein n=1 Tax=Saccharothrix xinjiangensis TaxID=204798 RepID=A0ABV9XXV4_9PSEU